MVFDPLLADSVTMCTQEGHQRLGVWSPVFGILHIKDPLPPFKKTRVVMPISSSISYIPIIRFTMWSGMIDSDGPPWEEKAIKRERILYLKLKNSEELARH